MLTIVDQKHILKLSSVENRLTEKLLDDSITDIFNYVAEPPPGVTVESVPTGGDPRVQLASSAPPRMVYHAVEQMHDTTGHAVASSVPTNWDLHLQRAVPTKALMKLQAEIRKASKSKGGYAAEAP